jgi:eukaryotic-like serine/threonine-protein kinase
MVAEGCLTSDEVARYVDPEASTDRGAIASHIDSCEPCRQVVAAFVRASRSSPAAHSEDAVEQVDRYTVFEPLGVGGMGVVYRAYDPRLDRKIALKVLRPGLCDERNRERMQNEAKMLAKLAHPNVVAVHDAGTWSDRVYIAMELVEGVTLRDWLAERPRSWREIVDILLQAGEGLASAHAAGLVHRDFKPQNVLVGSDGRARVSDFGLAERGPSSDLDATPSGAIAGDSLTASGTVLGTPAYMSPEHFVGGTVDASSDQFSFCVTAYEALFGERPFPATTFGELRARLASGKLPDPPQSRVPRRITRCVLRGLAIDRARRYPDMRALVSALRGGRARSHRVAIAATAAVALGAAGWLWARPSEAVSPEERCESAATAAADTLWNAPRRATIAGVLTASGLGYARDIERVTATRLADYATSWRAQYVDACRATRVFGTQTEAMLDLRMACLDDKRRHVDALVARLVHVEKAQIAAVPDALAAVPDVQACSNLSALASRSPQPTEGPLAKTYNELADELAKINVARDLGELDTALAQVVRAQPKVDALGNPSLKARFRYIHGELLDHAGRGDEAAPFLEEAVYAAEAARDQETKITALVRLYMIAGSRLDKPAADRWSKLAEASLAAGPANETLRSYLLLAQGMYAYQLDDMPTAATKFEQALAIARQDPDSIQQLGLLTNLASVYFMQERDAEAKKLWDEALAYARHHYGPEHPDLGIVLGNIALFEATAGDLNSAIGHYEQALAIAEGALGKQHPRVGKTHLRLAEALAKQPDHAKKPDEHFKLAVEVLTSAYPKGHPDIGEALTSYAMYAHTTGDFRTALALYERARVAEEQLHGADDPSLFTVLHGLGSAHLELHEPAIALPLLRRARELRLRNTQASPESLARLDQDIARAQSEAKRR